MIDNICISSGHFTDRVQSNFEFILDFDLLGLSFIEVMKFLESHYCITSSYKSLSCGQIIYECPPCYLFCYN